MKLLIMILSDPDVMDRALEKLERRGIRGATILRSRGMAMELQNYMGGSFWAACGQAWSRTGRKTTPY